MLYFYIALFLQKIKMIYECITLNIFQAYFLQLKERNR